AERFKAGASPNPWPLVVSELMLIVLWPWGHARLKAYQHGHARCGTLAFRFDPSTAAFYGLYGMTFLVTLPFWILIFIVVSTIAQATKSLGTEPAMLLAVAAVYTVVGLAYAVAGGFFAARLQRLVWTRTHAGSVRFSTTVEALGLARLWIVNGLLTLLT